jgi:hypothetical protein
MNAGGKLLSPKKAARAKKLFQDAAILQAEADARIEPEANAARRAGVPTLRRALTDYLTLHELRAVTIASYRQDFRLHFADWLDIPAATSRAT